MVGVRVGTRRDHRAYLYMGRKQGASIGPEHLRVDLSKNMLGWVI